MQIKLNIFKVNYNFYILIFFLNYKNGFKIRK